MPRTSNSGTGTSSNSVITSASTKPAALATGPSDEAWAKNMPAKVKASIRHMRASGSSADAMRNTRPMAMPTVAPTISLSPIATLAAASSRVAKKAR